ncbi:polysaccharide biosynthesis protein [Gemmatimonadota bacterium]
MDLGNKAKETVEGIYPTLHRHRRLVSLFLYGLVTTFAFFLAFLLRFELVWPVAHTGGFWTALPLLLALRLSLARVLRLSTSRWRFIGTQDVVRLVVATAIGSLFFFILTWELGFPASIPRSVIALEWVFTSYGTAGMWVAYRILFQQIRRAEARNGASDRRVLVVGAGEAGAILVREMMRYPTGFRPIGMVDDDPLKWGTNIHGVEVIGSITDVKDIAESERAEELIIAIPTASPAELNRIVEYCEGTDLTFKLLPGIAEVLAGEANLHQVRPIRIEDLLGREPITLELPELAEGLRGEAVLVTGAAGSIGSELSLQIALHTPRKLLLLDQAETPLVDLHLRLGERFPKLDIVPMVGDITNPLVVDRIFRDFQPDQVFHAAAYKHVPMMEQNRREAVRNNVFGTWVVARAAGLAGSSKFVLVSTDKAVRPANVMGATKRLAELVVLDLQTEYPQTAFAAVRFGNVLGSSGSVIPLFRRQLEEGKPLTVTHPEITRYFMTIPEAVQLVLQASLLPDLKGHVTMLDMGEPVRVLDLAKKILRLSGSPVRIGREIVYSGLRPGEKLHEELVAPDETAMETAIPRVRWIVNQGVLEPKEVHCLRSWLPEILAGQEETAIEEISAAAQGLCTDPLSASAVPI